MVRFYEQQPETKTTVCGEVQAIIEYCSKLISIW